MIRYGHLSPRRYWLYWVLFYFGIPSLMALQLGASEASSATFAAKHHYFMYFFVASLPSWWAKGVMTWTAQWVLRPWSPHLMVVLIIGSVLGTHISGIWAPLRHALFEPYLVEGSTFYPVFPWRYQDPDYLMEAVMAWITGAILWVGASYFFLKVLKFPLFGHGVADVVEAPGTGNAASGNGAGDEAADHGAQQLLWEHLPENLGRDIVALKAEEHYTRVFTEKGEALILMRFRDAIGLLQHLGGVQTHRSYWVNTAYVAEVEREGRSSRVRLTTGQLIPVSRSYRVMVQNVLADRSAA